MPVQPVAQPLQRFLTIDGVEWVAYQSGAGSYGTGHWGLAPVHAVHFAKATAPRDPLLEALLPPGRLEFLFDRELLGLFRNARQIVKLEPGSAAPQPRRFSLEEDLP